MSGDAQSTDPQPPVGIDLGTTYSAVAYLDNAGRPTLIPNRAGDLLTPSAVLIEDGEIVIGREAVKGSMLSPESFAECFKRDMGADCFHRKVNGVSIPSEILSSLVLERLREDAERKLGSVRQVVITVPAFFDESRRKATQEAGHMAGLDVLDIINEPTAAAVALGYQLGFVGQSGTAEQSQARRLLVYDLGGGTFDVTLLEVEGDTFRAVATDGDVQLGGKDFDQRIAEHLATEFREAHGLDPLSDPEDAAQLLIEAQLAKHALSERAKTTVITTHAGIRMRHTLTREQFADLTLDLIERTESTTSLLLKSTGYQWTDVDRVLLVGGSTRMPMVVETLRRLTGKEPDQSQNPDEAVAQGAAIYAGMLMQGSESPLSKARLINVNSHALGVVGLDPATHRRVNAVLIPKNTPLPHHAAKEFCTAKDGQRSVKVPVVEGDNPRPEECISLGECVIRNLPTGLPKGSRITVEYRYAANGRISVAARIHKTRQSAQVEINRERSQPLGDLASWKARLRGQEPLAARPAGPGLPPPPRGAQAGENDRATLLKRLDENYRELGKATIKAQLPPQLARSQRGAQKAAQELYAAHQEAKKAESDRRNDSDSQLTIRLNAAFSKAKAAEEQMRVRSEFALLVLGRDCTNCGVRIPGTEKLVAEIERLRTQLQTAT